jgi:SAM-dependent methyltransferase
MKTLVLGHGKRYVPREEYDKMSDEEQEDYVGIKCVHISISVNDWYYDEHISVNIDPEDRPDIVYNLWKTPWTFAESNSYDRIIDTCYALCKPNSNEYRDDIFDEIMRVLKPDGIVYGRVSRIYKKKAIRFKTPYDALPSELKVKVTELIKKEKLILNSILLTILRYYKSGSNEIEYSIDLKSPDNIIEAEIAEIAKIAELLTDSSKNLS